MVVGGDAGGDGDDGLLAGQLRGGAVHGEGPAEGEDLVLPLLEQRGGVVLEHRVLEDDHVVFGQQCLLGVGVDVEVGVGGVQVVHVTRARSRTASTRALLAFDWDRSG